MAGLKGLDEPLDDGGIEVGAAEEHIATGAKDLDGARHEGDQRRVEGTAAEIEDEDGPVVGLVALGREHRRSGGLVDHAAHPGTGPLRRAAQHGPLGKPG